MLKLSGAVRRVLVALVVAAIGTGLIASTALAHERREVGDYTFVVGFLNEPAIVEEPNGLDLRVSLGDEPVEGLANTLQAEIIHGSDRLPLEIRARFGQPGAYVSDIIPTELGAYSFHIFGTIEGTPIDETFTSGPDTFSEVTGRDALTFPNQVDSVGNVQATANDASDTASTAMLLGIVGLVAGLLALVVAVLAFMRASARREPEPVGGMVATDATD